MAVRWVLGGFGTTVYPTDGQGGSTATATSSALHNVKSVEIVGFLVNSFDATTVVEVVDSAGTTLPGMTFPIIQQAATQTLRRDIGVLYTHPTNANIGIKIVGAAGAAILLYEP